MSTRRYRTKNGLIMVTQGRQLLKVKYLVKGVIAVITMNSQDEAQPNGAASFKGIFNCTCNCFENIFVCCTVNSYLQVHYLASRESQTVGLAQTERRSTHRRESTKASRR